MLAPRENVTVVEVIVALTVVDSVMPPDVPLIVIVAAPVGVFGIV
jgi:hypothetical protein